MLMFPGKHAFVQINQFNYVIDIRYILQYCSVFTITLGNFGQQKF